jgi:hypothetical protein
LVLAFQNYASSILNDTFLGAEVVLSAGAENNTISAQFSGAYYGEYVDFNKTVEPFLSSLPEPSTTNFTRGDYITGLAALAYGPVNTSTEPQYRNNFYIKSLMTPEDELLTEEAIQSLMEYSVNSSSLSPAVSHCMLFGGKSLLRGSCLLYSFGKLR